MLSDWLELDSQDEWVRCDAETVQRFPSLPSSQGVLMRSLQALMQELAYASYLNVSIAVLPPPRNRAHVPSYARAIHACLNKIPYMHFSVRVPLYDPVVFQVATPTPRSASPSLSISSSSIASGISTASSRSMSFPHTTEEEFNSMWGMWDVIRTICESNPRLSLSELFRLRNSCTLKRLSLALDLTPPLPLTAGVLDKWLAEPTRQIFLPASTFIANSKSYPVLPKGTQSFIRNIMKVSVYAQLSTVPFVTEIFSSYNLRSSFQALTPVNTAVVGRRLIHNISGTSRQLAQGCKQ